MAYPRISVDGAIVVITGGARGIGRSTAESFTAGGATVCVGDIDGGDFAVDVTSRDSFAEFIAAVIERHGRIDVLVNNAGVMPLGDFLSEDDAVSRTTFDVNVWGLIHGMRSCVAAHDGTWTRPHRERRFDGGKTGHSRHGGVQRQ